MTLTFKCISHLKKIAAAAKPLFQKKRHQKRYFKKKSGTKNDLLKKSGTKKHFLKLTKSGLNNEYITKYKMENNENENENPSTVENN